MKEFFSRSVIFLLAAFILGGVLFGCSVSAALPRDAYQASLLSFTSPTKLAPGEIGQVRAEFQNIGTATWLSSGKNFVSLYRWNPATKLEVASQLAVPAWETPSRPIRLPVAQVSAGRSVAVTFPIKAPFVPGIYTETFILTAEDIAWMKYGQVTVKIEVGQAVVSSPPVISSAPVASAPLSPTPVSSGNGEWAAELVEKSGSEWQLDPEGVTTITLVFKNAGTKTWTRDSVGFLSLYATDGSKERSSLFKGPLWNGNAAVRLKEREVRPGQVGTFVFQLRAPKTAGNYKETFTLAAENSAWLKGSTVTLPIRVISSGIPEFVATGLPDDVVPIAVNPPTSIPPVSIGPKRTALLLLRSVQRVTLLGNGRQEIQIGYKNTGEALWTSRSLRMKGVMPASNAKWASIRDDSWYSSAEPVRTMGNVKPGEIGFLTFKLKAPAKKGTYTASFALYADGERVEGGDIDIPITVTADGYIEPEPILPPPSTIAPSPRPSSPTPAPLIVFPPVDPVPLSGDVSTLPAEPMIRVGIYRTTDDQMVVRAKQIPIVVSQSGTMVCRLNTGESATVQFDRTNKVYKLFGGSCTGQSSGVYVFRAEDGVAPIEIADFSRPVSGTSIQDNLFRAQLELRYAPATDGVWVINELPIEWYLKGIAETSNVSPPEFQRTLLVTARTYAVYHVQRGTKHADEYYTVDAKYDQVYRGYGAELRNPNVVAAVDATRGQIVTYQGKLAITPYFSRSDGRTRSWGEVWYGASQYPWLVSVPVPQDQGKTLWGHGVGMSASGALAMANEGKRYNEILTYFYQGTELRKAYR